MNPNNLQSTHNKRAWENSEQYALNDGYIVKMPDDPKDEPQKICKRIEVLEIRTNIETNKMTLLLSFDRPGGVRQLEVGRGTLTKRKILELREYGADVVDNYSLLALLIDYLRHAENVAPVKLVYGGVGFQRYEDRLLFKLHTPICEPGKKVDGLYNGNLLIEPCGELKRWRDGVREHVMGRTQLEVILAAGFAAPIVAYLKQDPLLVHLCGNSTEGKTSACCLAVSAFGCPDVKSNGLVQTWNATENALVAGLRNNNGVPVVIDEASIKGATDFTSLIYVLAGGKDKARCNKESGLQEQGRWSGVIFTNAEHSLKAFSKKNEGIDVRLFEFANVQWTKSAQHAEAMNAIFMTNYGQAGRIFVRRLLKCPEDKIQAIWRKYRSRLEKKFKNPNHLSSRIAAKLALILVAAVVAKNSLKLDFNIGAIMSFLAEHVDELSRDSDLGSKAYSSFQEAVVQYAANFSIGQQGPKGFEQWGKLFRDDNGQLVEVAILPEKFRELMKDNGFEDANIILKEWRKRGWLKCDKGRLTRKREILPGSEVRTHVVLFGKTINSWKTSTTPKSNLSGGE